MLTVVDLWIHHYQILQITLSEIDKKDCKSCKERKSITSQCAFNKLENNRLIYKCKKCDDISYKPIDALKETFLNTYQLCNKHNNKFILLLRKGIYPYEYMDRWGRYNETILLPKKEFYNNLNLDDINEKDFIHAQKVWNTFKRKDLGDYHDLYIQTDTLLLADIFENFIKVCIEIYQPDPTYFFICTRISMASVSKKDKDKARIINRHQHALNIWRRH